LLGRGSKKVFADAGIPPACDGGMVTRLETSISPPVVLGQFQSFWVKLYKRNYGDLPKEKTDPSRCTFKDHSKSMQPTQINRQPMTSY